MLNPAYERPDYEPAPAAPVEPARPEPAIGYVEGIPHKPVTRRPGLLGWWLRFTSAGLRPATNECIYCKKPTPGYSWCSQEHSDAWDLENPI